MFSSTLHLASILLVLGVLIGQQQQIHAHVEPRPDSCPWLWRGNWSLGVLYAQCDTVTYNHSLYVSMRWQRNGPSPSLDTTGGWELAVLGGAAAGSGAAGLDGANGTTGQGYTSQGAWQSSTAYVPYDVVTDVSGLRSYVAVSSSTNDPPPSASWLLFADRGITGTGYTTRLSSWSSGTTYSVNDVVPFSGSAYVALQGSTGATPDSSPAQWLLWVGKGSKGDTGASGTSFVVKGNWDGTTTYAAGDLVVASNHLYAAISGTTNVNPTTDGNVHWFQLPLGPTGPQGQSLVWQDAWDSGTAYAQWDVVTYGGSTYLATAGPTPVGTPPSSDSAHWTAITTAGGTGLGYGGTSSTSQAIVAVTTSVTLTLDSTSQPYAYQAGTRIRVADATNPTVNFMEGVVTSFSSLTLTFTVDQTAGSGTVTSWTIHVAGDQGKAGTNGNTGGTGIVGAGYAGTSNTGGLTIASSGTFTFTLLSGQYAYQPGTRVRATDAGNTANYIEGIVTSVPGTTLTLSADRAGGSGTPSGTPAWRFSVVGDVGIGGVTGGQGSGYGATSATTGVTIASSGSVALTLDATHTYSYQQGDRIRATDATTSANYMEGVVTSYNTGTRVLTFTSDTSGGSGTPASGWLVDTAGPRGTKGDTGAQGIKGNTGTQGNTGNTGADGLGYAGTTSSNSVALSGSGSHILAMTSAQFAYQQGTRVRATDTANLATKYMEGVVTAATSTSLTFTADRVVGSGTPTQYAVSVAGDVGQQGVTGATGASFGGTSSTSSVAIGASGSKTLVLDSVVTYAYQQGDRIRATDGASSNYMEGVVTSVSGTSLTFTADKAVGSNTPTSWTISTAADKGASGTNGGGSAPLEIHVLTRSVASGSSLDTTSTTYVAFALNTITSYGGTSVTLASNQFTMVAGTYLLTARGQSSNGVQDIRLFNTNTSSVTIWGSSFADTPGTASSHLSTILVLASKTRFELQHVESTGATELGSVDSFASTSEVGTLIEIMRLV